MPLLGSEWDLGDTIAASSNFLLSKSLRCATTQCIVKCGCGSILFFLELFATIYFKQTLCLMLLYKE